MFTYRFTTFEAAHEATIPNTLLDEKRGNAIRVVLIVTMFAIVRLQHFDCGFVFEFLQTLFYRTHSGLPGANCALRDCIGIANGWRIAHPG